MVGTLDVSVVVTCFNGAETIADTIDSILAQSVSPSEVIVVDDGSSDESLSILLGYGDRICVITQENGGPSKARNTGIAQSSGPWISLCDGDDLWHPAKLERQIEAALSHPEIKIFATSWRRSYGDLSDKGSSYRIVSRSEILRLNQFQTSTVFMARSIFDDVGTFDTEVDVAEDWEMWIRAALTSKVYIDDTPLVMYRDSPKGVSKDLSTLFDRCPIVMGKAFDSGGLSPSESATLLAWHRQRILIGQILTKNLRPAVPMVLTTLRSASPSKNIMALTKYTIPFLKERFSSK